MNKKLEKNAKEPTSIYENQYDWREYFLHAHTVAPRYNNIRKSLQWFLLYQLMLNYLTFTRSIVDEKK